MEFNKLDKKTKIAEIKLKFQETLDMLLENPEKINVLFANKDDEYRNKVKTLIKETKIDPECHCNTCFDYDAVMNNMDKYEIIVDYAKEQLQNKQF